MATVYLTETERVLKKAHKQLSDTYIKRVWTKKGEKTRIADSVGTTRGTLIRWMSDYNEFRKGNIETILRLALELKVDIFKNQVGSQ